MASFKYHHHHVMIILVLFIATESESAKLIKRAPVTARATQVTDGNDVNADPIFIEADNEDYTLCQNANKFINSIAVVANVNNNEKQLSDSRPTYTKIKMAQLNDECNYFCISRPIYSKGEFLAEMKDKSHWCVCTDGIIDGKCRGSSSRKIQWAEVKSSFYSWSRQCTLACKLVKDIYYLGCYVDSKRNESETKLEDGLGQNPYNCFCYRTLQFHKGTPVSIPPIGNLLSIERVELSEERCFQACEALKPSQYGYLSEHGACDCYEKSEGFQIHYYLYQPNFPNLDEERNPTKIMKQRQRRRYSD